MVDSSGEAPRLVNDPGVQRELGRLEARQGHIEEQVVRQTLALEGIRKEHAEELKAIRKEFATELRAMRETMGADISAIRTVMDAAGGGLKTVLWAVGTGGLAFLAGIYGLVHGK